MSGEPKYMTIQPCKLGSIIEIPFIAADSAGGDLECTRIEAVARAHYLTVTGTAVSAFLDIDKGVLEMRARSTIASAIEVPVVDPVGMAAFGLRLLWEVAASMPRDRNRFDETRSRDFTIDLSYHTRDVAVTLTDGTSPHPEILHSTLAAYAVGSGLAYVKRIDLHDCDLFLQSALPHDKLFAAFRRDCLDTTHHFQRVFTVLEAATIMFSDVEEMALLFRSRPMLE